MGKQVPLEVTQGLPNSEDRPYYAPEDLPVEQRGGVPVEVWETNRSAAEGVIPSARKTKAKEANADSQPDVPDDWTQQEIARSAELGKE